MTSRITRVPFGFQDLLGSKNFGVNPADLAQIVAPTIDIGEFFKIERRTFQLSNAATTSADGTFSAVTVPEGELWLVEQVGTTVVPGGNVHPFQVDISVGISSVANSNQGTVVHPLADLGTFGPTSVNATVSGNARFLTREFPSAVPVFADEVISFFNSNGDYSGGRQYTLRSLIRYLKLSV